MNAKFETDAGTTFDITTRRTTLGYDAAVVLVVSSLGKLAVRTPLTKSEARAIASALMGAAAEL